MVLIGYWVACILTIRTLPDIAFEHQQDTI